MTRRRAALTALVLAPLLLGASECEQTGPGTLNGTVVEQTFDGNEQTGIRYLLKIRKADGSVIWVREAFGNWSRCTPFKHYPNCKYVEVKTA